MRIERLTCYHNRPWGTLLLSPRQSSRHLLRPGTPKPSGEGGSPSPDGRDRRSQQRRQEAKSRAKTAARPHGGQHFGRRFRGKNRVGEQRFQRISAPGFDAANTQKSRGRHVDSTPISMRFSIEICLTDAQKSMCAKLDAAPLAMRFLSRIYVAGDNHGVSLIALQKNYFGARGFLGVGICARSKSRK